MTDTVPPLVNKNSLKVLDAAVQIFMAANDIEEGEIAYNYNLTVNAGVVSDIVELLLLFVGQYEDVDTEALMNMGEEGNFQVKSELPN